MLPETDAAFAPQWAAAAGVGALMSTRRGGVSRAPWSSLNLGVAVGDDADAVAENRRRFASITDALPVWLRQVHGARVLRIGSAMAAGEAPVADAAWTDEPGVACTIQVADCLPLLLAAPDGRAVAAAHVGWRGLAAGVVEAVLQALCEGAACEPAAVATWLGPCIGPRRFEVGADVLLAFGVDPDEPASGGSAAAFRSAPASNGTPRWLADLAQLTRLRLQSGGVREVAGGQLCTVEDGSRFFSYRRDGVTGRLAAAVWIRRQRS